MKHQKYFDFYSGAKSGVMSGAISGGVMGGIFGYYDTQNRGRNPWTGSVKTDEFDFGLEWHPQKSGDNKCKFKVGESIEEKYGYGRTAEDLEVLSGSNKDGTSNDEFKFKWGHFYEEANTRGSAYQLMKKYGLPGYAQSQHHSTGINLVQQYKSGFFNIKYYKFFVMDPDPINGGAYIKFTTPFPEARYNILFNSTKP